MKPGCQPPIPSSEPVLAERTCTVDQTYTLSAASGLDTKIFKLVPGRETLYSLFILTHSLLVGPKASTLFHISPVIVGHKDTLQHLEAFG